MFQHQIFYGLGSNNGRIKSVLKLQHIMKNRYQRSWGLLLFLLFPILAFGQKPKDDVKVAVKPVGKNLIVRWAPTTDKAWLRMKDGFAIVSYQSWSKGQGRQQRAPWQQSDTVRVWSKQKITALINTPQENPYVMLAGYIMHEPYETLKKPGLDLAALMDRKDELTNRFSSGLFAADMDALAAEAQCMRYTIKDFDPAKYYTVAVHLFLGDLVLNNVVEYNPDAMYSIAPTINKHEELDQKIVLSWDQSLHAQYFTAYWIERSRDGKSYEKLTKSPYLHAFDLQQAKAKDDFIYTDSVKNYIPYYYRIIGLDPFGSTSEPSAPLRLMGRDKTPPTVSTQQKAIIKSGKMHLYWEQEADPDLHHFNIEYSRSYAGIYTTLSENINKNVRTYEHATFEGLTSNYYKVCAVDTAGNKACTTPFYGFFNDTIPPAKPTALVGEVDTLGRVRLSWPLGKEADLKGYNVYFSNRYNGVFSILNHGIVRDTQFLDTINLNSLTRDVFYKITAVDVRDNISLFSDMARIVRPDTIPPGAAVFKTYQSTTEGIRLVWANPSTADLAKVELWRKAPGAAYQLVQTAAKQTTEFLDQGLQPNTLYSYQLVSYDRSGLKTTSPRTVTIKSSFSKKAIPLSLEAKQVEKTVQITVLPPNNPTDWNKVVIYKSINGKPFVTWKTLPYTSEVVIKDLQVQPGRQYQYKAYSTNQAGVRSPYSAITSISIKSE
jgi:hypothetical protein